MTTALDHDKRQSHGASTDAARAAIIVLRRAIHGESLAAASTRLSFATDRDRLARFSPIDLILATLSL